MPDRRRHRGAHPGDQALFGDAAPACADVDHDGRLDPVLVDRDLELRTDS